MPVAREGRALRRSSAPLRRAAVVSLAISAACGPGAEPATERAGTEPRVVSLVPAASGILVALGAGDLVVGRTSDDRTEQLAGVPSVGRVLRPDPERIAALRPGWVLAWAGGDARPLKAAIGPTGGVVVPLRLERLGDVRPGVLRIAEAVGRRPRGERLVEEIEEGLRRVHASVRARAPVRTVWVVWADPPVVAGPETLPDDLLELAGGVNLFADARTPWPRPSREALVTRAPDAVVWPTGPGTGDPSRLPDGSVWRLWPSARFLVVDGDLVHQAGARVAEAAAAVAGLLHDDLSDSIPTPHTARGGPHP